MSDLLHDLQGPQFDRTGSVAEADKLEGDVEASGADGLPDLAEAAVSQ